MGQQGSLRPRKRPRQRRSRETVDAILEAAARVFAERGHAGGTTNHIAVAAGVSVGSLYEYFPNKDAILVALVERQVDAMVGRVQEQLASGPDPSAGLGPLLSSFVTAMLEAHEQDSDLYRIVFSEAAHPPELHACVLQMEESLAHSLEALLVRCDEVHVGDTDTAAHLVMQTAEALTHRFVHHGIHDLDRDAFVREVVTLLSRYVSAGEDRSDR
jgi:AcrR family transcriptional regulator